MDLMFGLCVCVNKIVMLFTNRSIGILYRRERERERGCVDLVFSFMENVLDVIN